MYTEDVYVYCVDLPPKVYEHIVPCLDGYTVYIDQQLTRERQVEEYNHAVNHVIRKDHSKNDVAQIEKEAHERGKT